MSFGFLSGLLGSSRSADGFNTSASSSASGGEAREDGKVAFGFSLMRGKRGTMEDVHFAQFRRDAKSGESIGCFGVYDGHGGIHAAEFVKANLYNTLLAHPKFPADPVAATVESYEAIDAQYCSLGANRDDGCTAVTALVQGGRLIVANVGDSRAILCRAGRAIQLSIDHKPNAKEERQRVERAGGVVVWAGTWRVGGVLAVSRAFGDKPLKRYVTGTPDVKDERLTPEDEFLILASDGLWDVCMNQDAVDLVRAIADPEKAAKRLTAEAYERGSNDNITVVIVRFKAIGG